MKIRFKKTIFISSCIMILCTVVSIILTQYGVSDRYPVEIAMFWLFAVTVWMFVLALAYMKNKFESICFLSSYLVRILFFVYRVSGMDIQNPNLTDDAAGFWRVANQYYEGDFSRVYTQLPYILNAEFQVFGTNYFCCILVNIILTMLTILVVINLIRPYSLELTQRLCLVCLISFFPYSFILCTNLWREGMYLFCLSASFAVFSRFVYTAKRNEFYLSILILLPVLLMHIGYFPIVIVYFYMSFKIQKVKTKKEFIKLVSQVVLLFIVCSVMTSFESIGYIVGSGGIDGIIAKLTSGGTSGSVAGSAYLTNFRVTTLSQAIILAPLRWFFYSFSPLMVNWRGITDVITFFSDSLIHLAFYLYCVGILRKYPTYKKSNVEREYMLLRTGLISVFLCGVVFGLGTSNAGTALRHRDVMIGIEIMTMGFSCAIKNCSGTD